MMTSLAYFDRFPYSATARQSRLNDFTSNNYDFYEDEADLIYSTELPGVNPENLDVQVTSTHLYIGGEKRFRQSENPIKINKSYRLTTKINQDQVTAKLENGILTVRMGKAKDAVPRRIKVE